MYTIEDMKRCYKCKKTLDSSLFYKCNTTKDGLQGMCKECDKKRYSEYYPKEKKRFIEAAARHYQRKKEFINSVKDVFCKDCGKKYPPICMDFDHINGGKRLAVSSLLAKGMPMKEILNEIKKCEPICSNCHRIRTWKRQLKN